MTLAEYEADEARKEAKRVANIRTAVVRYNDNTPNHFHDYPVGTVPRSVACGLASPNHDLCYWAECKCPCHDSPEFYGM